MKNLILGLPMATYSTGMNCRILANTIWKHGELSNAMPSIGACLALHANRYTTTDIRELQKLNHIAHRQRLRRLRR